MMPAANQGVGMNTGFPDVCTTPAAPSPIPVPYPNIGMNAMAVPFIPNIMVSMAPAQNMGAKPALTNGDNAGVAHPLFMQPGGTTMGNPRIMMGGMPAAHLAVPTYGNNFNNPVGSKLVPSVTNVLLGYRAVPVAATCNDPAGMLHREAGRIELARHNILQIRLPCVSLRTDRWLTCELRRFRDLTLRGILLDLRGNPGGSVVVAQTIAAMMCALNLPIAVATDQQTASAAELLAATLQDLDKARIFGASTHGKTQAATFHCSPAGMMRIPGTTTTMLRPDHTVLDEAGVTPDEFVAADTARPQALRWLRQRDIR